MNNPKQAITIMAEFAGAYAFRKGIVDKTRFVGYNFADTVTGFPDEMPVSKNLEQQFCRWAIDFENNYINESFDWCVFHNTGKSLTQDLTNELGDGYIYYYRKPVEDPDWKVDSIAEAYPNGWLNS